MANVEGIYRRVSVRLWTDEKVGRLSPLQPSGQALWVYLLTGPHTGPIPGVFVAGRAALAEALNWEIEDFDQCAAELMAEGLVRFDKASRLWFIPNALRHNPPASPNVVTGWRTAWTLLPECPMRDEIAEAILVTLEASSEAFAIAFAKVCGKASDEACAKPSGKASAKTPAHPSPNQETGNRKQEAEEKPSVPVGPVRSGADAANDSKPQELADVTQLATKQRDPEGFAEFWAAWPSTARKVDRKRCAEKWRRGKLGQSLAAILAHVEAMKLTKPWREGYEPAPLKYLDGERWRDGMPPIAGRSTAALDTDHVFGGAA